MRRALAAVVLLVIAGGTLLEVTGKGLVSPARPLFGQVQPKKDKVPAKKDKKPAKKEDTSEKDLPPSSTITEYGGKTLKEWVAELKHSDPSKRAVAVGAIMLFTEENPKYVREVATVAKKDSDLTPRTRAVQVLRSMNIEPKDMPVVIDALAHLIDPQNQAGPNMRFEALLALSQFLPDAKPAIPALIGACADKSTYQIRHQSISLLWRLGQGDKDNPPHPEVVNALIKQWSYEKAFAVRLEIIQGLGAMGRPANKAQLAQMINLLDGASKTTATSQKPLAIWAYTSLVMLQDGAPAKSALKAVSKFLDSKSVENRVQAVGALGTLGSYDPSVQGQLIGLLKDSEPMVVQAACNALSNQGKKDIPVIVGLLDVLDADAASKEPMSATAAVLALSALKANESNVRQAFERHKKNEKLDIRLRHTIETTLKEFDKKDRK